VTPPALLLDTNTLLWWLDGDERLSPPVHAASRTLPGPSWSARRRPGRIATKHRLGKLPGAADVARNVRGCLAGQGFEKLAIALADAERTGRLPGPHRDPFDRMLIAQAQARDLALVSNEALFDGYGARRVW
jgi:PIN domain nuclease of toxin-antitoxin system